MQYVVTSQTNDITKHLYYEGVRVLINSNSSETAKANFKKLDDLQINDTIALTDNYGAMGGGKITIKRVQ